MRNQPGQGRKPKSALIKKLEGNRKKVGAEKIREEPKAKGRPTLPDHLNAEERRLWGAVVGSLPDGLLSRADDAILERFAVAWATFREAHRLVRASSLLVQTTGGPARNPLLVVRNAAAKEMHLSGGELGLSPVARARLTAASTEDDDPMSLLLGMDGDEDAAWAMPPKGKRH